MEPKYIQHYTIQSSREINTAIQNIIMYVNGVFVLNEENEYVIRLILNELVANGFIHGNNMEEGKKVEVVIGVCRNGKIIMLVKDEGKGYDYQKMLDCCPEPKEDEFDCLMESGRGLKLVKTLSDEMVLNRKGNMVLVKMLLQ